MCKQTENKTKYSLFYLPPLFKKCLNYIYVFVHMCVCSHTLWMSENNSRSRLVVTSSHHMGARNQAEVVSTEPSHWSANPFKADL